MSAEGARVLIVGGGPAGAMTACLLARAGIDAMIVDRARFPRAKACSEYLSPEASRLLEVMGVLGDVEEAGAARLVGMRVHAPRGSVIHGEFASPHHDWRAHRPHGLALTRDRLDVLLLDAARRAGARVREGVRVVDVARDERGRVTGVVTLDADGQRRTLGASLVIGADGLQSIVARRLGLARRAGWPRRIAIVAHYSGVAEMSAFGEMHVERAGYTGLADVGNGLTNVAVVVPATRARELEGDPDAYLERWIAARPSLARRFRGAQRTDAARATGPFASRARRAFAPGAALVGDAADFFDPFTGEEIYAALRGGELLATHVRDALRAGDDTLLDRSLTDYDAARRREFSGKWSVERLVAAAVAWPWLLDSAARALADRRDLADLLVGVTGDFVPAREVLRWRFVLALGAAIAARILTGRGAPPRVDDTTAEPSDRHRFSSGAIATPHDASFDR